MDVRNSIRQSYLAKGLTDEQLDRLNSIADVQSFHDGDVILEQFDTNQDMYILASGRANVLTMVGEPIGVVKPGMPIGEMAFLDSKPRSVSIVSAGETEAVHFPSDQLRTMLREREDIALTALQNISRVLCARLRAANNNLAALMAIDESQS